MTTEHWVGSELNEVLDKETRKRKYNCRTKCVKNSYRMQVEGQKISV